MHTLWDGLELLAERVGDGFALPKRGGTSRFLLFVLLLGYSAIAKELLSMNLFIVCSLSAKTLFQVGNGMNAAQTEMFDDLFSSY
jgi:hypothetical protein